jgi:hypothetical protein
VTAGKVRNVGASVRAKLLDLARRNGDEFNFILTRYGLERLLFRLASSHRDQFVLKGAMLFPLWSGSPHRATHDMDLLAFGPPTRPLRGRPLPLRGRGGLAAARPGDMADDLAAARGEAMGRNGLASPARALQYVVQQAASTSALQHAA